MPDDFRFDVFLSHSAKDKEIVRDIAERLKKDGVKVWFDEWVLKPGDSIPAKIEEGLERSRVLVLCMSANAFGSDWAQLESGTFRFRDPLNKEHRFLPLRLDDAPIRDSLAQFLYINWLPASREQEHRKLLQACQPMIKATVETPTVDEHSSEQCVKLDVVGQMWAYVFSPNGKTVLTVSQQSAVQLWDVESGRCKSVFDRSSKEGPLRAVAWSADQKRALTGGWDDYRIWLWDVETGHCLNKLEGHTGSIYYVAWSVDQRHALSASSDHTLRLWNVETGHCLREFKGHTSIVHCVAWSVDQCHALSGSDDNTLRLWDVETGHCLREFKGHTSSVRCVAWSVDQCRALSGSDDNTLRLWDVETGRCLRIFEGHTGCIWSLAWSSNQRHALSGSGDYTVRLWDVETGRCLRRFEGLASPVMSFTWGDNERCVYSGGWNGDIRIWDLTEFLIKERATSIFTATSPSASEQVQYTNAKVLLVGDTGVGKSGLAGRLIHKEFAATKSSHARKAHVLESKTVPTTDGVALHQETVLWDLAGQPAYRLVHQLSMEDAALACVLFDNRSETNPFEGAAYWSQVLDQARANTKVSKILVASRIDVGGLPASRERIEAFAKEHGFALFIPTSANTGEGCVALLDAIRGSIPWNELPKVTTEGPLAPLRAYIAGLKGEKDGHVAVPNKLFTVADLHEGFCANYGRKISRDEFISHLSRLEDTDAVDLLVFHSTGEEPRSETLVLLDPTRVDAYASALLVAAKDEPDGPGHLLESRVRDGSFKLSDEERLADDKAEKHVLWFVVENLLARDLALREKIRGEDYLVFPSQCTAELKFPGIAVFGVAFGFTGPVRSIYATLIAQLAHFEGFKKREFFHDAATYRPDEGGRCIVRLRDEGRGRGELLLSFEEETPAAVRQGFIEFVNKHLESKSTPGSVTKRHAHSCGNKDCRKPFEDAVVKARLEAKKKQLVCPYCDAKTPLLDLFAAPTKATESVAARMDADAKVGRKRMTAGLVIKAKEAEGKFDVFLSHNSRDKAAVENIAKQLMKVGIRPWLDKWHLAPGDTISDALEKAVKTIPCAALCFGPADTGKWHIMEIRAFVERWAAGDARMIPMILPSVKDTPELPMFVRQTLWVDMRDWETNGHDGFYRLVCGILGKAPGDSVPRKFGAGDVAEWQGMKL